MLWVSKSVCRIKNRIKKSTHMSKLMNLTCGADKELTGKIALLKSEKDLVLEPMGDRGSFGDKLFSVGEVGVETFLKYLCCKSSASKDSKISC